MAKQTMMALEVEVRASEKLFQVKRRQGQGKCQGGECADAAPFRGGKEPRIDAADGHHENKQNRQRHDQGFRFFRAGNGGLAGPRAGLRHTLYQMTSMKQSMQVMPGSTPAMNRSPMD